MIGIITLDFWLTLDRRLATYLDIPFVKGVLINQVFKSSPAEKAGLRLSDIILSCNGVEVKVKNDIFKIIHEMIFAQENCKVENI